MYGLPSSRESLSVRRLLVMFNNCTTRILQRTYVGHRSGRDRDVHRDPEVPGAEDPIPTRSDREPDESHLE